MTRFLTLWWLWLGAALLAACYPQVPTSQQVNAGTRPNSGADALFDAGPPLVREPPEVALCRDLRGPDGGHPDWAQVVKACELVLQKDPRQPAALKARQLAQLEVTQQALFDDARTLGSKGNLNDALAKLIQVTAESAYYAQARAEAARLLPEATRQALAGCVGPDGGPAGDLSHCQSYGDLACFQGWDNAGEAAFRATRTKAGVRDPFQCASPLATLVAPLGANAYFRRQSMIKKKYVDPALEHLVLTYAEEHAKAMSEVRAYRKAKPTAEGRQLTTRVAAAVHAYQAAFELMNQGDLDRAAMALGDLANIESEFMPMATASESFLVLRSTMLERSAQKSLFLFEKRHFPESYAACARAHSLYRPTDPPLHCMQNLENKAALLLGSGCPDLKLGASITQPSSELHGKLVEQQKAHHCK